MKKFIVVKDSMPFRQQQSFVLENFNLQKENLFCKKLYGDEGTPHLLFS